MIERVAKYLLENYYVTYTGENVKCTPELSVLIKALEKYSDKFFVLWEEDEIRGVVLFLTLSDETYARIEEYNLYDVLILTELLEESGENYHFFMLTVKSLKDLLKGLWKFKRERKPKTMSWWNPTYTFLHKYKMRRS